jgi:hypothetical protein
VSHWPEASCTRAAHRCAVMAFGFAEVASVGQVLNRIPVVAAA